MGSGKAPTNAPPDDEGDSSPPPPNSGGSKTSPSPQKSTSRSPPPADEDNSSPPPPPAKNSPPPPAKSSPPPPDEDDSSPPPPIPKNSPPPAQSSPPPSPTPQADKNPPATTTPSPPPQQKPAPTTPAEKPAPVDGTKNPAVPAGTTPAATGGAVNSPAAFVAPPPALAKSNSSALGDDSSGKGKAGGSSGGSGNNAGAIAGGVIGGAVFVAFVICIWLFCRRKKKQQKHYNQVWNNHGPSPDHKQHAINIPPGGPGAQGWSASPSPGYLPPRAPPGFSEGGYSPYLPNRGPQGAMLPPFSPDVGGTMNQNHLAYEDLVIATNGFANANMLGQGGFGYVHKGVLASGKEVAVKCLKLGSGQGEREFHAEVDIISRVHHRHLVSLVGYSISDEKRLLVYEFVPNNTLEYHLHKGSNPPLDFSTRVRIALGSAKGLAYLHEDCHPRIIHRDIKAANILLDYSFEAQVADFGLARLYNDTNTHVSTRVMGTFGYLAPEYASSGKLTDKSDVFSFGVVLLELITGRRPVDPSDLSMEDDSLVDWARPLLSKALTDGNYDELADRRLEGNYNTQEMSNMVGCAAASIRHSAKRRPRMSQVVRTLEGDMSGLEGTRMEHSAPSSNDYDTAAYNADMKKFRQMAFGTQEHETGGSLTTTSEYGLNHSSSTSAASSNENSPRKT